MAAALDTLRNQGAQITLGVDGNARFVRFAEPGWGGSLGQGNEQDTGLAFLQQHGPAFGLVTAEQELDEVQVQEDSVLGGSRRIYQQQHQGVPVYGAGLRLHFDSVGTLRIINGYIAPTPDLDPLPTLSPAQAENIALAAVAADYPQAPLEAASNELQIRHEAFEGHSSTHGEPGNDVLVFRVEVNDLEEGAGQVRTFVEVDAHSGDVIAKESGIHELHRMLIESVRSFPGPSFTWRLMWREGDPLTGVDEHDNIVRTNSQLYRLFRLLSGGSYLSYDGADSTLRNLWGTHFYDAPPGICPNAWWNGSWITLCPEMGTDDITAHEWVHAYTEHTHNLRYKYQQGALNESYSDIFGELVDRGNSIGLDSPSTRRGDGRCSTHARAIPTVTVTSSSSFGPYWAGAAQFGPKLKPAGTRARVELVDDGSSAPTGGCESLVGFTHGRIALIDRGGCDFDAKVRNAQRAGAVGAIICNHTSDSLVTMTAGSTFPPVTIPSVFLGRTACDELLTKRYTVVSISDELREDSYRWLLGEGSSLGVIRDMWNPECLAMPGKVSDSTYHCESSDNYGVHTNSSVPNHAFALLADGGSYNGHTVPGIGAGRAGAIYWRAMSVYQSRYSDFSDHADALEQSCDDLKGTRVVPLPLIGWSLPSVTFWPRVEASHCDAVRAAMDAVEMRAEACPDT